MSVTLSHGVAPTKESNPQPQQQRRRRRQCCSLLTIALAVAVFTSSQVSLLYSVHSNNKSNNSNSNDKSSSASAVLPKALQDFLVPQQRPSNTAEFQNRRNPSNVIPKTNETTLGMDTIPFLPLERLSSSETFRNNDNDPSLTPTHHQQRLPQWLQDYLVWHRAQTRSLTPTNYRTKRFLVMQCLARDRCGGTADRIKPIPVLLWFAASSQRILLIRWERPAPLEEFLLPPTTNTNGGGLDWRVPAWLGGNEIGGAPYVGTCEAIEKALQQRPDEVFVRTKYQSHNGGQPYYDDHAPGPKYVQVYHDVWRTLFTPAPPVAALIQRTLRQLHLVPGNYAAAHFRALYARAERPEHETKEWAVNAVNCASELRPGGPIYFASDTRVAIDAVQEYAKETNRSIVSLIHDTEPLHLEKVENWTCHPPADFYSTFVDLYLLGMSRCVSYNVGGFGRWGLMMSYNASCEKMHSKRGMFRCEWKDRDEKTEPLPMLLPREDASLRTPVWHNGSWNQNVPAAKC